MPIAALSRRGADRPDREPPGSSTGTRCAQAVEAQIRAVTGLDLVVNGRIDVSVFPGSYVSFHDVGLKGGGTADPALQVDVLTANLRLLPLLLRRFEIADVMMLRPHIRVVRDGHGESNWTPFVETHRAHHEARRRKPGVVFGNPDPGRRAQLRGRRQPRHRAARRHRSLAGLAVDLALVRRDRTIRLARRARRRLDHAPATSSRCCRATAPA